MELDDSGSSTVILIVGRCVAVELDEMLFTASVAELLRGVCVGGM